MNDMLGIEWVVDMIESKIFVSKVQVYYGDMYVIKDVDIEIQL